MTDWRQVQARIRKAKASAEAPKQLAELYERTRDAMVAFELAQWQERAGDNAEAARWYTVAAEKFRRAQWRTKAQSALARLGAPVPEAAPPGPEAETLEPPDAGLVGRSAHQVLEPEPAQVTEIPSERGLFTGGALAEASGSEAAGETESPEDGSSGAAPKTKRRRRGRRGGRNRRGKRGAHPASASSAEPASQAVESEERRPRAVPSEAPAPQAFRAPVAPITERLRSAPGGAQESQEASHAAYDRMAASRHAAGSRTGEPALASRMAHLEAQIRRLLACPQGAIDEADQAPAGPGVLLLSDADQVTHYYVEACQTLRIGIANLLRGGRGSRDGAALKERMAENLGVSESRVSKYLKEHCVVRWLQLDEGASELAHFAIAVLRPVVNE